MVRFKHRYLLCELVSDDPRCRLSLDDRVLSSLVRDTIARVHGTFGAAACSIGFAVRYLNAYTGIVLLRCRKEFYQLVWSALPFITYLENKGHRYPCFFNTLHVGGRDLSQAVDRSNSHARYNKNMSEVPNSVQQETAVDLVAELH
ncbi:PREDICTED: ribonuclease P/MRP protein subunit POP5 isoform X2 [Cercocebus atys]|uniref:ribonuclease P/MRP protein subunit POP5 isoform X2 n=1 Tax=Cercocebus atys TaxID=9531 RepID=UPI0003ABCDD8|nr:ribonuclease P/MRP protein subunit POP5 isoform X2 [Macaca fascicularis]XP_011926527.1 PREDICTED: ribonuclease P/MRP protein subunit POP5 isoform X2 [Cercocebus atys]XP_045222018.1 ribonuclease P/MRP protein subunit POP5 isoform X2 [Macaca fascicularis]